MESLWQRGGFVLNLDFMVHEESGQPIVIGQVDHENWQAITKLEVLPEQRKFVAEPSFYLAMCAHGGIWQPLAIGLGPMIIGFLMWAYDGEEDSCWLGGFIIDRSQQRKGYGRRALTKAVELLAEVHGYRKFALSYKPANIPAKNFYTSFGFSETGEWAEDELVARFELR